MTLSRRSILIAAGATGGLALMAFSLHTAAESRTIRWSGMAFGADATVLLHGLEEGQANALIMEVRDEIERLESIFSLYRPDSALARLNCRGRLDEPPIELVELLNEALAISEATEGAFDPTIQPLYAEHFSTPNPEPSGPPADRVAAARALADFRAVEVAPRRIGFRCPGMALTLNGIAQGFATDRVAALLRRAGVGNLLVDLGETGAHGRSPRGRAWTVGIRDPFDPTGTIATVTLNDEAVATSGGYGTLFEPSGRFHHLLDPATGHSANHHASASVVATRATLADGLSTACAVMPPDSIAGARGKGKGAA